ncbi:MAG TPA: ATPase, T2SS/T4P/T4SS family [Longimicrobiales bacterium]
MHWLVELAQRAGWSGAETLTLEASRPTAQVWPVVSRALGIGADELAERVAGRLHLRLAVPEEAEPYAVRLVPMEVARRFHVFPIRESNHELMLATYQPLDMEAEQALGFVSGRRAVFEVAPPEVVDQLIDAAYGGTASTVEGILARVNAELADSVEVLEEEEAAPVRLEEVHDAPIIRLTNLIIHAGVTERASDIHIAPAGVTASVRLRIDGVLRHHMHLPLNVLGRIISRIKIMGKMDIADRLRPQDGRTRVVVEGKTFDLRISVVPTRDAEKAVIRILDPAGAKALEEIELPAQELARVRQLLGYREGIVFVTGPTGSGKTTTLYAALRELAGKEINIITVEDPVEYELPGVTQIQVEAKRNVTFASALRAILRQDPDVILVGEIRDLETAEIAVQAAMTGHLVLATLHTNDAAGAIPRLVDIGLDRPSIAATVRGVLAQRLVRRLCSACALPVTDDLTPEESRLAAAHGTRPTMRAVGCDRCSQTGYRGRVAEAEVMVINPAMAELITAGANAHALQRAAAAAGMRPLHDVALERVRAGVTTLQEVERVLGEAEEGAAKAAAVASAAERPRILLAEDDPVQSRLARGVLEKAGFEVTEAADGHVAWVTLRGTGGFSLVLTDLRMPNLDGTALLERIRGSEATADVPVVVLTSVAEEELEVALLDKGADDYIRKPFEPARLVARVRAALRRAGGASALAAAPATASAPAPGAADAPPPVPGLMP